MKRLLPHPVLSAILWMVWLALHNSVDPAQVLLGAFLAWLLPLASLRLADGRWPPLRRPLVAAKLVATVLYDVVVANIEVARRILGPEAAIEPGFIRVPLDLTDDWAITTLAGIITMTPGTLTAGVAADRSHLLVHAFHVGDGDALVASIKTRYELPLKEIYG